MQLPDICTFFVHRCTIFVLWANCRDLRLTLLGISYKTCFGIGTRMLDWFKSFFYGKKLQRKCARRKVMSKPTPMKSILAKCWDCIGHYVDGKKDCENPTCPLYSYMPYRVMEPDLELFKYNHRSVGKNTLAYFQSSQRSVFLLFREN